MCHSCLLLGTSELNKEGDSAVSKSRDWIPLNAAVLLPLCGVDEFCFC